MDESGLLAKQVSTTNFVFHRLPNQKLWLDGNHFVGRLTESLPVISPSISFMDVSNNRLSGSIPDNFFSNCGRLVDLYLETNLITGQLPENTARLTMLENFKANSNRFTGTLPVSWMKLDRLRRFVVANNSLTGTIPSEILDLSALQALDLVRHRMMAFYVQLHQYFEIHLT